MGGAGVGGGWACLGRWWLLILLLGLVLRLGLRLELSVVFWCFEMSHASGQAAGEGAPAETVSYYCPLLAHWQRMWPTF